MYYLYKISVARSPIYYIGVSGSFEQRKLGHLFNIKHIIFCKKYERPITVRALPAQIAFADVIYPHVKHLKDPSTQVGWHLKITVLRRSFTYEKIKKLETEYLQAANENCLNIHRTSYYNNSNMKEKLYVIRGNNKNDKPCVVKIIYGNRYVIAKFKEQPGGLMRIENSVNAFIRGGSNNPNGLYFHLLNYIKRQPDHKFKVQTLIYSDNAYELLKREQEELDNGRKDKNFLNNQTEAYIPQYNEDNKMYGGWIPQVAVLNFKNWLKSRKKAKKTAV